MSNRIDDALDRVFRIYVVGKDAYFPYHDSYEWYTMLYALAQWQAEIDGDDSFPKMPTKAYKKGLRIYDDAIFESQYVDSFDEDDRDEF